MTSDALGLQALNRALLARQRLLAREPLPAGGDGDRAGRVIGMVEHLAGLQAQAPFPPYYGLWSRLDGFRPDDLAELITGRQVVRIALMRGTIHLVSARDCLTFRPLLQPVLDQGVRAGFARQLKGVDTAVLAAEGRALVEDKPRTFSELGELLSATWPDRPADWLARGVRTLVPLVQVRRARCGGERASPCTRPPRPGSKARSVRRTNRRYQAPVTAGEHLWRKSGVFAPVLPVLSLGLAP